MAEPATPEKQQPNALDQKHDAVFSLYAKQLITKEQAKAALKQISDERNQFEGLASRYIGNLSKEISDHWAGIVAGLGEKDPKKVLSGLSSGQVGLHALGLLTGFAGALSTSLGDGAADIVQRHGGSPQVAAIVGTAVETITVGKMLNLGTKGLTKTAEWAGLFKKPEMLKALAAAVPESAIEKATAIVEKQNPKNLVDFVRPPQDMPLPGKAGKMVGERKLLPAPEADKEALAAAEAKMKSMEDTHDLLTQAQQTLLPPDKSEATKTLDAAAATLRGGSTAEQIFNDAQRAKIGQASDDLLERTREAQKKGLFVGGGGPSPQDYVKQFNQTVKEYQANLERYQAHGLTREMADSQANKLMSEGYGLDDIMAIMPGEAKNPAQTLAVLKTAMPLAEESLRLREAAKSGNNEAFIRILGNFSNLFAVNPRYFGIRSTTGQTLGIYRDPTFGKTKFLDQFHEMASWLAGLDLKDMNDVMANKDRILAVLDNFKTPEQFIAHGLTKPESLQPGWLNIAAGYFAQNLLSPLVLTKKIFGDTAATLYRPMFEKPMERFIYKGLSNFYENPLGISINDVPVPGESIASLYGYRRGWMRAWDHLRSSDWNGLAEATGQNALTNKLSLADLLNERFGRPGQMFGNAIGAIPTSIKLLTNAARLAAFESEASGRLFREGVQIGKTGPELADYVEQGMRNLPPHIMKSALEFADEGTFTDAPGAFASWVSDGLQKFPLMKFDLPFWRIPFNLLRWGYQRSPVLSLTSVQNLRDLSKGGIEAADAASKMLLGNIAGGGIILGGYNGWITGTGPTDPALRREMIGTGDFPPLSIWNPISRNWFDYSLIHPMRPILGTGADIGALWSQLPWNEGLLKNTENMMWSFGVATARNFGENPFFTGITSAARTIEDLYTGHIGGTKAFERGAGQFLTGLIPLASTWRYVAQTIDPGLKEVNGIMDEIKSNLPGFNSDLKPKRDMWGRPEMLPDTIGPRPLSILRQRDGTEDPLGKEHMRLQIAYGDDTDHIFGPAESSDPTKLVTKTGVPLNDDEKDFRNQRKGELYRKSAESIFNDPSYSTMPDAEKIRQFRNARGDARTQATYEAIDKYPDLKARVNAHMASGDVSVPMDSPIGESVQDSRAMRETEPQRQTPEFFPLGDATANQ